MVLDSVTRFQYHFRTLLLYVPYADVQICFKTENACFLELLPFLLLFVLFVGSVKM